MSKVIAVSNQKGGTGKTTTSDFLDAKQVKELLRLEHPLSACYNEWLKNDFSYMDMLQNTVDDFSRELVKENEQAKKKKRNQPER